MAFGERDESEFDLRAAFNELPMDNLLTDPSRAQWRSSVHGSLQGLELAIRYCPSATLLGACVEEEAQDPDKVLHVEMKLDRFWFRKREGQSASTKGFSPCLSRDALCSTRPLHARLDGNRLVLLGPWSLRSGGRSGVELKLSGGFDLTPVLSSGEASERACTPGVPQEETVPEGDGLAHLTGAIDLAALEAWVKPLGIAKLQGQLAVDLDLEGRLAQPKLSGLLDLPPDWPAIAAEFEKRETTPRSLP